MSPCLYAPAADRPLAFRVGPRFWTIGRVFATAYRTETGIALTPPPLTRYVPRSKTGTLYCPRRFVSPRATSRQSPASSRSTDTDRGRGENVPEIVRGCTSGVISGTPTSRAAGARFAVLDAFVTVNQVS